MIINKLKRWKNFSSKVKSSFYLTTPIFYVNANPHIGHLYSAVIADAINRYHRLRYPQSSVHFSTGTDEHGTKIQQAASRHNVPVDQYCADISSVYKQTFHDANVDYCDFIRTTDERHKLAVAHFWQLLKSRGHIYDAQYSGWYCISDETFLTESQLKTDSTNGVRYSIESGHPVEWTEETNYMFKLSKFQNDILHWVKQGGRIRPEKFEKILLNYLSEPLLDISVSRPSNRVQWAISVPDDDTQTVYVWFDALVNYLTSVGYPKDDFKSQWPPNVQVIGKDILKFHGIYWPAFLIAAGLEPPQQLFVHSHWTVDGQKMSKSKFNVVDPQEAARIYTMEGLRYFLLREGVSHSDGNFSNIKAIRVLNSELADTLGNLLSRGCAKSLNPRQIHPRIYANHLTEISQLDATKRLMESLAELPGRCKHHYDENNFYMVVDTVISTLHAANNFFETCKPWELKKTTKALNHIKDNNNNNNNNNAQKLETIISMTMDTLRLCGIILQPIIPELSGKLLNKLNVPASRRSWQNLNECFLNNVEFEERPLGNSDAILFNRIIQNDQRNENEQTKKQPAALKKTKKVKNIQ